MKFLGVVALFGFVEQFIFLNLPVFQSSNLFKMGSTFLILGSIVIWGVILNFHQQLPYKVPFQLFAMKEQDDMISICEKIKEVTPRNAVFIQPFENTELKFYAERSSYIEFKANVRNKAFVKEWANREAEVFGVLPEMPVKGFALQKRADDFFYSLDEMQIKLLKRKGVTYLLTKKEYRPTIGNLILQNNTYAVYQL